MDARPGRAGPQAQVRDTHVPPSTAAAVPHDNKQAGAQGTCFLPVSTATNSRWGLTSGFLCRPGCCAGEASAAAYKSSTSFPDETLTFIKTFPLMDESVPSVDDRPYFTRTTSRYGSSTCQLQGHMTEERAEKAAALHHL